MEELKNLLQQQKTALASQNMQELNSINKKIFAIREARRESVRAQREAEREKMLSAKIWAFCEKIESCEER